MPRFLLPFAAPSARPAVTLVRWSAGRRGDGAGDDALTGLLDLLDDDDLCIEVDDSDIEAAYFIAA